LSTQQRTTHSSMQDNSGGGGCGVFLIIAGLGLAVLAIGFGLITAFFTIEMSESETVISDVVVEDVSAVEEEPTTFAAPRQPLPATYPERVEGIRDRIRTASDNYTSLMSRIGERDAAWDAEMLQVFTTWRDADTEVGRIVPPPAHQASHQLLTQATDRYRQAAHEIEQGLFDGDSDSSANGTETLASAAVALLLAEASLDAEVQ
jgi:hypothetical protein